MWGSGTPRREFDAGALRVFGLGVLVAGESFTDRRLIRHAPRSAEALCPNRHRGGRYTDGIGRELAALGDVEYRNTSAQKTKRQ